MGRNLFMKETRDMQTGEVVKQEIYSKQTDNAEQFARIFFHDIEHLAKCTGAEKGVVLCCMRYLEYNTNELIITPERREAISIACDSTPHTVSVSISKLRKKNIIIKKSSSTYIINPNILFYGDEKGRKQAVRDLAEYKIGGVKRIDAAKKKVVRKSK